MDFNCCSNHLAGCLGSIAIARKLSNQILIHIYTPFSPKVWIIPFSLLLSFLPSVLSVSL